MRPLPQSCNLMVKQPKQMAAVGSEMAVDNRALLAQELGGPPPQDIAVLKADEVAALVEALRQARRHQKDQLKQAMEKALGHLPLLLRAPVRKIISG
jgi:hypothetical protein